MMVIRIYIVDDVLINALGDHQPEQSAAHRTHRYGWWLGSKLLSTCNLDGL